ncbi:WD domain, G-beta repeat domain containing protein [Plasmodium gonderi]|uniref:WD domain, G-beta repeat domain containing protein n=1 Tax=Plasmodium gonderi TaxID=77519 RepID=A0A1Y1JFB7_PLAGO|nr:WD domain, G-beta repeat domain containing protein [Plasmodium gonderi]GAW81221.1 WD domain, G-beta repeat domain containing protein [Plasmodium gonderi]
MEEDDETNKGMGKQILIQFVNHENKATGPVINVPLSITKDNLDEIINDLKKKNEDFTQDDNSENLNYSFMINDKLAIKNNLYDTIKHNNISSEDVLSIKYFPLNIFKIKKISTCNSTLPGHTNSILSIAFSPNSAHLATGAGDNTVRLWDINTQTPIATLKDHNNWVLAVLFSPDNQFLATSGMDQNVCIYETSTGKLLNILTGHKKEVTTLCFEPLHLLSKSNIQKNPVHIRKRKKTDETKRDTKRYPPKCRNDASQSNTVDNTELGPISGHNKNGDNEMTIEESSAHINRDEPEETTQKGKREMGDQNGLKRDNSDQQDQQEKSDTSRGSQTNETKKNGNKKDTYFVRSRLASAGKDGCIRINNILSNSVEKVLTGHTDTITCILWSGMDEKSSRIYSSSRDTTIKIWNFNEGTLIYNFKGHKHWVNCLSLNTERIIKNGIYNLDVIINKMHIENNIEKSKNIYKNFFKHTKNEKVVSGSDDGTLYLIECLKNDEFKHTRLVGHQKTVIYTQFSPDGKFIASCSFDKTVRLWSGLDGHMLAVYRGHVGSVYKVAWSIDNNYIVSCSQDSTLKLWKVSHLSVHLKQKQSEEKKDLAYPISNENVKEIEKNNNSKHTNEKKNNSDGDKIKKVKTLLVDLPGHADAVYAIDWSNDGKFVASGGKDKLLKIWSH